MWIIEAKYGKDDFYPKLEKEILSLIDGEKISSQIFQTFLHGFITRFPILIGVGFIFGTTQIKNSF